MTGEKYNLLERLGALIADSLYQHYQGIVGLSVTVRKPSVPISGILIMLRLSLQEDKFDVYLLHQCRLEYRGQE